MPERAVAGRAAAHDPSLSSAPSAASTDNGDGPPPGRIAAEITLFIAGDRPLQCASPTSSERQPLEWRFP
jgi:hypothetical protein